MKKHGVHEELHKMCSYLSSKQHPHGKSNFPSTTLDLDRELMTSFVALLRAVNVGGTGKLPMADLKQICKKAGFGRVETYIASGNVILQSEMSESEIKEALERALAIYAGKKIGVLVRTARELEEIVSNNPFKSALPNRTVAVFLNEPYSGSLEELLAEAKGREEEEIQIGKREIYIHYGEGMAQSRLKIPAAEPGTARNINTIMKLAELAAENDV